MRINAKVSNVMPKNVGINNPSRRAIKLNILVCTSISRLGRSGTVSVDGAERFSYYFTWVVAKLFVPRGLWMKPSTFLRMAVNSFG